MSLKSVGKAALCRILEAQVKQLRRRNNFVIIAVAGSVGKTSTKLAIARTLAGDKSVIYQDGNYNDRLTVPLVLFGLTEPGIYNILAWFRILMANRAKLRQPYGYEIAVLELGTDAPGQLQKFAYLQPDITVITAVAAEHMQYFGDLDAVAREELTPLAFSQQALLNIGDIDSRYLPADKSYKTYGSELADYALINRKQDGLVGQTIECQLPDKQKVEVKLQLLGAQGAKIAVAALAISQMLGLPLESAVKNLANIIPTAGRMQILPGKDGSTIIDDTYNASPTAMLAALDVLYSAKASQRIAILGSMNELGNESDADHQQIGKACDPSKLDLVVTIGKQANEQLAPAAKQRGCQVQSFLSPYDAGHYVLGNLKNGAVVLAKGSQNGVFAEEAVKPLLKNPEDSSKLVRQSVYWLKQKLAFQGH